MTDEIRNPTTTEADILFRINSVTKEQIPELKEMINGLDSHNKDKLLHALEDKKREL